MKNGVEFLCKNKKYLFVKSQIEMRFGTEKTEKIWASASKELDKLMEEFKDIPSNEHSHTDERIFPRIAVYRALKAEVGDEAMPVLDEIISVIGKNMGKKFGKFTSLPGMNRFFVWIFGAMCKKAFGEKQGFRHKFYDTPSSQTKFDIIQCPYNKYCTACGCPELTRTFCDSDIYCYGSLPGVHFERSETLGTGGNRCDFGLTAIAKK